MTLAPSHRSMFQELEERQHDIMRLYLEQRLSLREVAKEMKRRGCTFSYRCLHEWLKERGFVRPRGSMRGHGRAGKPVRNVDCDICHRSFLPASSAQRYCRNCIPNGQAYHHWKTYGLTIEQFDVMMQRQGGKCAGCKSDFAMLSGVKNDVAHVDHCHLTGEIRGLLCRTCNHVLGLVKDSPETLQQLITYLNDCTRPLVGVEWVP